SVYVSVFREVNRGAAGHDARAERLLRSGNLRQGGEDLIVRSPAVVQPRVELVLRLQPRRGGALLLARCWPGLRLRDGALGSGLRRRLQLHQAVEGVPRQRTQRGARARLRGRRPSTGRYRPRGGGGVADRGGAGARGLASVPRDRESV